MAKAALDRILQTRYASTRMEILSITLFIVALAFSITFHEFMHAFTSFKLGDDTALHAGRLSLNPLRHIDPFATVLLPLILFLSGLPVIGAAKPVQFNPARVRYGEMGAAMVAVAGPLTNLVVAIFFGLWSQFLPVVPIVREFFTLVVVINVGFFVFNMIPFPPLDGSRLFYAFAPDNVRQVMRQIESFGLFGILIFLIVLFPLISPVLARAIGVILRLLLPGQPIF